MKKLLSKNLIVFLSLLFLVLLLILWGRMLFREMRLNTCTHGLTTTNARLRALKGYGWEVDPGSETQREVAIPQTFDPVWENYNRLQTVSGLNLLPYRGKKAICYTYLALNFPYATPEPVYLNLLIVDGTLVAGDCMSRSLDGFMLPLDRRYLP